MPGPKYSGLFPHPDQSPCCFRGARCETCTCVNCLKWRAWKKGMKVSNGWNARRGDKRLGATDE